MNMKIRDVQAVSILEEAEKYKHEGYRLMQICATRGSIGSPSDQEEGEQASVPAYEILYTFGMGFRMEQIKVTIPQTDKISSITSAFPCAFLYENEMHDLFGVDVRMMNLDYRGNLYRTAEKTPFK
ncbi:MAG: NADH-quinone oxidoreductase subunit C [Lachnospiraceae bacterium]|nr:NADH-quinone oxidoreductase subunit C [Lachnospiraceae bacterium]